MISLFIILRAYFSRMSSMKLLLIVFGILYSVQGLSRKDICYKDQSLKCVGEHVYKCRPTVCAVSEAACVYFDGLALAVGFFKKANVLETTSSIRANEEFMKRVEKCSYGQGDVCLKHEKCYKQKIFQSAFNLNTLKKSAECLCSKNQKYQHNCSNHDHVCGLNAKQCEIFSGIFKQNKNITIKECKYYLPYFIWFSNQLIFSKTYFRPLNEADQCE